MTYNEVVYSIRERLRQNIDDSDITDREIIFHVNNQRALFYRNQYNQRNRTVDEEIKQLLRFTMVQDTDEQCGDGTSCYIMKSTQKLPSTLELHHKNAIFKVTSLVKTNIAFNLVSWNEFPYQGLGKYTKNEVFVTVGPDNYLYLRSGSKLVQFITSILVTAILENPLDIKNFNLCPDDSPCQDLDTFIYPIKAYAFAYIIEQVVSMFINKLQTPEDEENDSET